MPMAHFSSKVLTKSAKSVSIIKSIWLTDIWPGKDQPEAVLENVGKRVPRASSAIDPLLACATLVGGELAIDMSIAGTPIEPTGTLKVSPVNRASNRDVGPVDTVRNLFGRLRGRKTPGTSSVESPSRKARGSV